MSGEPKIILFDIETLADLHEVSRVFFGLSDYPGRTRNAQISSVLCVSYKVFGEKRVKRLCLWDYYKHGQWQEYKNADKPLLKDLHKIMSEADAVVAHNGVRFDWPFIQTRFALNGLSFLNEIPKIDTCLLARKKLKMYSNALNNLGFQFFGEDKIDNGGADLWHRIQWQGLKKDFALMAKYCDQDVLLLEKLFKMLRPFATNIPNYNTYAVARIKKLCPSCGSTRLKSRGLRHTKTRSYRRYRCRDCKSFSRTDLKDQMPRSI